VKQSDATIKFSRIKTYVEFGNAVNTNAGKSSKTHLQVAVVSTATVSYF
jgi:hypothetical protein